MKEGQAGLIYSLGLHAVVVTTVWVGMPFLSNDRDIPSTIPMEIEFIDVTEETVAPAPAEEAPKEQPKPTPQKETKYAAAEAPAPAPTEAVPTLEAVKKEIKKTPKPSAKPVLTARQKLTARVRPNSKPKPPSRFKTTRLAALIDKSVKKEVQKTIEAEDEPKLKAPPKAKVQSFSALKAKLATAALQDALKSQIYGCWNIPSGVKDVHTMQVKVRVFLRPDGNLLRQPQYVDAGDLNAKGREGYRTFAESARRAVQLCAPYERLPVDRYDEWKDIEFNFDASEMTG